MGEMDKFSPCNRRIFLCFVAMIHPLPSPRPRDSPQIKTSNGLYLIGGFWYGFYNEGLSPGNFHCGGHFSRVNLSLCLNALKEIDAPGVQLLDGLL